MKLGLQHTPLQHRGDPEFQNCFSPSSLSQRFLERSLNLPSTQTSIPLMIFLPSPTLGKTFNLHPSQPSLIFRNVLFTQMWYEKMYFSSKSQGSPRISISFN